MKIWSFIFVCACCVGLTQSSWSQVSTTGFACENKVLSACLAVGVDGTGFNTPSQVISFDSEDANGDLIQGIIWQDTLGDLLINPPTPKNGTQGYVQSYDGFVAGVEGSPAGKLGFACLDGTYTLPGDPCVMIGASGGGASKPSQTVQLNSRDSTSTEIVGVFYQDVLGNFVVSPATPTGKRQGVVVTGVRTFASYPPCSSEIESATAAITDSTTNTWGATITGGGSHHVLGYCDGTSWTVAAK
jgi:hypothetical protein